LEDWQYHVAMTVAILLCRKNRPSAADLGGIDVSLLSAERISEVMEIVSLEYQAAIPAAGRWTFSDISTSEKVLARIKARAASLLQSTHWTNWPNQPVEAQYAVRANDVFYRRITGGSH
jgi:hypothetical protein